MNGSRPAAALALAGVFAAVLLGPGLKAAQKKHPSAYATVAGTVFRDPGLALPGAKVVLMTRSDSKAKKLAQAETNYRGEFSFRVPAAQATYVLRASMKGFTTDEKNAVISGEEAIDVNLVLSPAVK